MKFVILMLSMGMFVGCAAKATTPSVQEQLDAYKVAVEADHTAMAQKNAEQDSAIAEINAKLDRGFRKGN
jgi:hypothetical protein